VENKTQTSEAKTAYGKPLDTPISYDYSWTIYQTDEELVAAKDELTLEEQRKTRNTERQNNARQKALTAALDAAGIVKPTLENDDQLRLREGFKVAMSSGRYTVEQAREVVATMLGIEWADQQ